MPRPGVKDVARAAGVAVGTVSNVLNRPELVAAETRAKVEDTMRRLGYVRNASASQLRSGVSTTVGVLVLDISNPFFIEAAAGVERRLRDEDCVMMLASSSFDPRRERRVLRTFESMSPRGILLTPADSTLAAAREIAGRGTAIVLLDQPGCPPGLSSVAVDDRAGARLALEHLIGLGHRHIAFLDGPSTVRQSRDREAGVRAAVAAHPDARLRLTVVHCGAYDSRSGQKSLTWILENTRPRPTAVFCANDLIALGAYAALGRERLRIPEDVSVVGFDDISAAAQLGVPLTTVRQPMERLGHDAADLLLGDGAHVRHLSFAPKLVVRRSTAPPLQDPRT